MELLQIYIDEHEFRMHSTLLHNSDLKLNNRYAVISAAGALITVIKENPHELKDRLHFEAFK